MAQTGMPIDTNQDTISLFSGLRDRDYAKQGLCVLEGRLVIEKAIEAGLDLIAMLAVPAESGLWSQRVACPVTELSRPEMEKLLGFAFHRGVLALAGRPDLGEWCLPPDGRYLVLWQVTDPDNLGALLRSAAALGFQGAFLGPGCADPLGRKALRASMGCSLVLPLRPIASLDELHSPQPWSSPPTRYPLRLAAALPVDDTPVRGSEAGLGPTAPASVALVLGNEGWGLPSSLVAACDGTVCIPMASGIDSLNVAAAGAILMWEFATSGTATGSWSSGTGSGCVCESGNSGTGSGFGGVGRNLRIWLAPRLEKC